MHHVTHNTKSTHKKILKPGLVTSYDIRLGNGKGWISKKIDKASKKGTK